MPRLPINVKDNINPSDFNEKVNAARRLRLARELVGENISFKLLNAVADRLPEFIPDNVSYAKNHAEATNMSPLELYFAVRNKGKWDYKQLIGLGLYEDFGNSNFANVTRANGIPDFIAKIGAGLAQIKAGTSPLRKERPIIDGPIGPYKTVEGVSFNDFRKDPNHGEDPEDQNQIDIMFEIRDTNFDRFPDSSDKMDSQFQDSDKSQRVNEPSYDTIIIDNTRMLD